MEKGETMKKQIGDVTIKELVDKCLKHYPVCESCDFENNCFGDFVHEIIEYSDVRDEIEIT
jgi:hypothetical protein